VLLVLALAAGLVVGDVHNSKSSELKLDQRDTKTHVVSGWMLTKWRATAYGRSWILIEANEGQVANNKIVVYSENKDLSDASYSSVGQLVTVNGSLRKLESFEKYLKYRGVSGAIEASSVVFSSRSRGGFNGLIDRIRKRSETALSTAVSPRESALLKGMVLGQDEDLTPQMREDFRRSGLTHIVAASGQNILLLAAIVVPLMALFRFGRVQRYVAALLLTVLYVPLAGAGPSIQRAGVMGAVSFIAAAVGDRASKIQVLLIAVAVTLTLNPETWHEVGWQLSFAAVIGILLLSQRLTELLMRAKIPSPVAQASAVTAAATVATAPFIAVYFGQLSTVTLLTNLAAAPAVAVAMWSGFLAAFLGQVSISAAGVVNTFTQVPLAYIEWLSSTMAALPHSVVSFKPSAVVEYLKLNSVESAALLTVVTTGLLAAFKRQRIAKISALVGAGLVTAALLLNPQPESSYVESATVEFLDIGQGDATLIRDRDSTVLVDTGPENGPLSKLLKQRGIKRIDLLVITHPQADHEGHAKQLFKSFEVGAVVDGGYGLQIPEHIEAISVAKEHGIKTVLPKAGQRLKVGGVVVDVLSPDGSVDRQSVEDLNDLSVVTLISVGNFKVLLTGDAESNITAGLSIGHVDLFKAAHHGSSDLGLDQVLSQISPKISVIPVGENSYGHPVESTLKLLDQYSDVFRTDRNGTVKVEVNAGGGLTVSKDIDG